MDTDMIRTVVFDMDGVLIDSERLILKGWETIAAQKGIPDIVSTFMKCVGTNSGETEAIFKEAYGLDFPYQKYKTLVSEIFQGEIKRNGLPMKPGVYELFDFLKNRKFRIGLASSTREYHVKNQMEMAGLLHYFDVLVCGDMVSHSKPHPEIYETACRLLSAPAGDCIAIEDSFNGIRSAYSAGMKPIMVPDLLPPDENLQKLLYGKFDSLFKVRDFLNTQLVEES